MPSKQSWTVKSSHLTPIVSGFAPSGSHPGHQIVLYAFDVLHVNGNDLTGEPPLQRRALLIALLHGTGFLMSSELPSTTAAIVEAVRGLGLEGAIAKRKDSLYEPGERSDAWQKLKLENQQEFVIGGYFPGTNSIDALLVGYYDDAGLRFAGNVRAGFVSHLRREVFSCHDYQNSSASTSRASNGSQSMIRCGQGPHCVRRWSPIRLCCGRRSTAGTSSPSSAWLP